MSAQALNDVFAQRAAQAEAMGIDHEQVQEMVLGFRRLLMTYRFGIDEVMTKITILREEFHHIHDYNPIEHVGSRLKSFDSILASNNGGVIIDVPSLSLGDGKLAIEKDKAVMVSLSRPRGAVSNRKKSRPEPPVSVSWPVPPASVSLPLPPEILSFPPPPASRLATSLPVRVSPKRDPSRFSMLK